MTVIYTRRPLLHSLCRWAKIVMLRYEISSAEQWIATCEREGIAGTRYLSEVGKDMQRKRVRLAVLEAS